MAAKLLSILRSVATALVVLTGSIAVPLLVRPFFYLHIKPLQLEQVSGLSAEQIQTAYRQVMDYCLGLQRDFSAGVLPFSAEGAAHFADVRFLFLLNMAVLALGIVSLVMIGLYCRHKAVRLHRFRGHGPDFWGCVGLVAVFLTLGLLAATDFSRFFTLFHAVFFPGKDNWLFDPRLDPVILILPEAFFRNCAVLILTVLLSVCMVLFLRDKQKN